MIIKDLSTLTIHQITREQYKREYEAGRIDDEAIYLYKDDGEEPQDGITPHIGENGNWFIGEQDTGVKAQGPQGEPGASVTPIFVNTIEECTDITALYVLPDGYVYGYIYTSIDGEQGSFGVVSMDEMTQYYNSTKTAYSFQKNPAPISGNLKSITFYCVGSTTNANTTNFAIAHMNGSTIESVEQFEVTVKNGNNTYINGVDFNYSGTVDEGDLIGFNMSVAVRPYYSTVSDTQNICFTTTSLTNLTYSDKTYGFAISAVVEQPAQQGYHFGNTGHAFVPADYEDRILALEEQVANFTPDEEITITEFNLANPAVKGFMAEADYSDSDYTTTSILKYANSEYYRKDCPMPIILGWNCVDNAVQYVITVSDSTYTRTYQTEQNKISIYNLVPNRNYYYCIYALCADSTRELVKDDNFTTTNIIPRMLYIEGSQNIRDIGGYPALNGTVKYEKLYRGAALDETIADDLCASDTGKRELIKNVGIKAEIDLRANITGSALGINVDFRCIPYHSYTTALTDAAYKANFKTIIEYIVSELQANKSVYFHCQAGCDRTGTIAFLLLGLLGVSESNLAKEYELSSLSKFSNRLRTRNSTTYDYSGMVNTIKGYSGSTLSDKFVSYANECGISNDTIIAFRNLMIE